MIINYLFIFLFNNFFMNEKNLISFIIKIILFHILYGDWGLGIGDWEIGRAHV